MNKSESQAFESVRREIARRLQTGLPLAGLIAATSLFCGCSERPPRGPIGKMPVKDAPRCEQKSEHPRTQATPKQNGNREQYPTRTTGVPDTPKAEPNRQNETRHNMPDGMVAPSPNRKNEKKQPITPGRTPKEPTQRRK